MSPQQYMSNAMDSTLCISAYNSTTATTTTNRLNQL